MQLLVEEAYRYYHQYLDMLYKGHCPLPDVTIQEMYLCLSQWRAVHGSKGSIASIVKKRKEKNSYINNSI
jgi:hypothetical protein